MRSTVGTVLLPLSILLAILLVVAVPVAAQTETVLVGNGSVTFEPRELEVPAGTTVTWRQTDALPHTVTASDGSFDSHPACNADGTGTCMGDGDTFSFTFADPGNVAYYCKVHGTAAGAGMAGSVTVVAAAPPPGPTEPVAEPRDPSASTAPPAPADPAPSPTAPSTPPPAGTLPETGVGWLVWGVLGLGALAGGVATLGRTPR